MNADWEALRAEVSADAPCGVDIAYDAEFLDLETLARGKTAVQFQPGEPVQLAEEPNWEEVEQRSIGLLRRSKDLRVALYLTLAGLRRQGLPGFQDGLSIVRDFLEHHWEGCFPLLDAEDDNDPTERLNVLVALSLPPEDAVFAFRDRLMLAPLCESRRLGHFGLRQVLTATGDLPPAPGLDAPSGDDITNAFDDSGIETLQAIFTAADTSLGHVEAIDALLMDKLGAGVTINFDEMLKLLRRIRQEVGRHLERRGQTTGLQDDAAAAETGANAATAGPSLSGTVNSTQDVIHALDRVCAYYTSHEPSSPVPLLLRRARRLVGKSFREVVQDLSPDAISQLNVISGEDGSDS